MVKVLSRALVLAVACLIAVSAALAQEKDKKEEKKKRERPTAEQMFKNFGSKDGKVLAKADFIDAAKKRATDKRPFNEERTLGLWKRLAGDKDSITFEEFEKKLKEGALEFGKRGGKKREKQ